LKIVQQLIIQVDQQRALVETREGIVDVVQAKLYAIYEEGDALQAAAKDEAMYLASLKKDLEFHTRRLMEFFPTNNLGRTCRCAIVKITNNKHIVIIRHYYYHSYHHR